MKKLLLATALLLGLSGSAWAQKSKSALTTEVNTNLASNSNISASILRTTLIDVINSFYDLGGASTLSCGANNWIAGFPTLSSINCIQPGFTSLLGTLQASQFPALTGDVTTTVGALATTLATVNANVGTFGSATSCITVTNNAKGLTTAISAATCTPAIGSVTGLGTGVATALGVNVGTAGAFVTNGGALGTPTSGVATNITGLPLATGVTGTLAAAQFPALTGDVTTTAGALATTLVTTQAAAHTWSATQTFNGAQSIFNPSTGVGGVVVNGPAASALTVDVVAAVSQNSYVRMGPGTVNMEFQTDPNGNWLLNTTGIAAGVLKLNRTGSVANTFVMDKGHIGNTSNTPVISVCGTAPSTARGSDFAGEVTTGTGAVTTCTITFGVAYTTAPYCVVTNQSGTALTYNITTTAINVTAGSNTSNKLNWMCSGT